MYSVTDHSKDQGLAQPAQGGTSRGLSPELREVLHMLDAMEDKAGDRKTDKSGR